MKKFFKAFGKATVYFLVYFLLQIVVSMIGGMIIGIKASMEMVASGEGADALAMTEQLTAQLTEQIMSAAMLMTMISGLAALFVFWIVSLIRKKKMFEQLDIRKFPALGIAPIALTGISFNLIITTGFFSLPFPQSWVDSYTSSSSMIGDGNVIVGWIATVLVAPIVEEVVFRGYMYTRLKQGMSMIAAAIITSLAFALVHGTIIWGIYTFVFSVLLIWTFEKYHSLAANIVLHIAFNLAGMVLSLIQADGKILTIILLVVGFIVFAGSMYWSRKLADTIVVPKLPIEEDMTAQQADM